MRRATQESRTRNSAQRKQQIPKTPKATTTGKATVAPTLQTSSRNQQDSRDTEGKNVHTTAMTVTDARPRSVPELKDKPSHHTPCRRGKMARCAACQWYVAVCSHCERTMCPDHTLPRQCVFDAAFAADCTYNSNANQRHKRYAEVFQGTTSADAGPSNLPQAQRVQVKAEQQIPRHRPLGTPNVNVGRTPTVQATQQSSSSQRQPTAERRKQKGQRTSSIRATAVERPIALPRPETKAPRPEVQAVPKPTHVQHRPVAVTQRINEDKHHWTRYQSNCSLCGVQTMGHCVKCNWSYCTRCRGSNDSCPGGVVEPSPPQNLKIKMENANRYRQQSILSTSPIFMDLTGDKSDSDTDIEPPATNPRVQQRPVQGEIPGLERTSTPPPSPSSISSVSLGTEGEREYQASVRRKAWRSNLLGLQKSIIQAQQELADAFLQLSTLQSQQLSADIRRDERFERAKRRNSPQIQEMVEQWQQDSRLAKYEYVRKHEEIRRKIEGIQTTLRNLIQEVDTLNRDDRLGD